MNYEQLWKGLKAKYEALADKCGTEIKNAEGKPLSDLMELNLDSTRSAYQTCDTALTGMARLENAQTKSERELIETTLDELRRDRLFERYRIKQIEFSYGKKGTYAYQHHSIQKYYDYELYEDGNRWFIVFHDKGNVVTYLYFENVEIVYWDEKKGE